MKSLDELLRALPPAAHEPDDREVIVTVAELRRYVRAAVAEERERILSEVAASCVSETPLEIVERIRGREMTDPYLWGRPGTI